MPRTSRTLFTVDPPDSVLRVDTPEACGRPSAPHAGRLGLGGVLPACTGLGRLGRPLAQQEGAVTIIGTYPQTLKSNDFTKAT